MSGERSGRGGGLVAGTFGPETAFVVHLLADASPVGSPPRGRVEHVRSGCFRHFEGAEEMVAFMRSVLAGGEAATGAPRTALCDPPRPGPKPKED